MGIQSTHDAKPKLCQSNIMMTGHLDITTRRLCGIGFFIRLPLADMRDRAILCSLASYSVEGFVRARGRRENEIRRAVDRYVISLVEHLPEKTDCILTAVHKGQYLLTLQVSRHCLLPLQSGTALSVLAILQRRRRRAVLAVRILPNKHKRFVNEPHQETVCDPPVRISLLASIPLDCHSVYQTRFQSIPFRSQRLTPHGIRSQPFCLWLPRRKVSRFGE